MTPVQAPARRARQAALVLSGIAILFSLAFGVMVRRCLAGGETLWSLITLQSNAIVQVAFAFALLLLLIAMLLRMGAAMCELVWLERTWSNLPPSLRRVGPIENVTPVHIFGIAFIPVVAWFWKLGLVSSVSRGFEVVRKERPFRAPIPRALGITAVVLGWFPPLNLYVAPFLWEMFARRLDAVCHELMQQPEAQ